TGRHARRRNPKKTSDENRNADLTKYIKTALTSYVASLLRWLYSRLTLSVQHREADGGGAPL
ncbi:hypothetical protein, partial [Bifidobacterium reuteri]|uniref:hypothetical protein n=1 Tax=Bifidobacterium reuteri TaxID=983706 RepID=UPI001CC2AD06